MFKKDMMKDKDLELIAQLMEELQDKMEYNSDDFEERLGRKKPQVEVVKIEGKIPLDKDSKYMDDSEDEEEYEMPMDEAIDEHEKLIGALKSPNHRDDIEEIEEQSEELEEMYDEKESPEQELKRRLSKLRG